MPSVTFVAGEGQNREFSVIPGRAKREPGIHNHSLGLWIPGLRRPSRLLPTWTNNKTEPG